MSIEDYSGDVAIDFGTKYIKTKTRKDHNCAHCGQNIPKGSDGVSIQSWKVGDKIYKDYRHGLGQCSFPEGSF